MYYELYLKMEKSEFPVLLSYCSHNRGDLSEFGPWNISISEILLDEMGSIRTWVEMANIEEWTTGYQNTMNEERRKSLCSTPQSFSSTPQSLWNYCGV